MIVPGIQAEWWTIEGTDGRPLATRRGYAIMFSRREYARQIFDRLTLAGARIVHHSGAADAANFLEICAVFGATRVAVDPGQRSASWIALDRGAWDMQALRQAQTAMEAS